MTLFSKSDREAMRAAYDKAYAKWPVIKCKRCDGRGYYYGFGEHGHDPEYCDICGGSGSVAAKTYNPITAAIAAVEQKWKDEGRVRKALAYERQFTKDKDGNRVWLADSKLPKGKPPIDEFPVHIIKDAADETTG